LRRHVSGRLICVFGCGGDRDPGKRPLMGEIAGRLADTVVLTSDNPRSEDPQRIIAAIAAGCKVEVAVEADRARAIRHAITLAGPGDCVLIAGKGHEAVQIIGDQRLPFSDIDHARAVLASEYPT
jgi:UDP-N-acetylmuramoyl-L-alanyl-D-glutamate--2,6-diaminopimelate ligase